MKFTQRTTGYMKWDHKRDEDIITELKIKPVTDYIQNYQGTGQNEYRKNCKTNFILSAKRTKISWMSNKRWEENMRL
jgi:hypothetical protein